MRGGPLQFFFLLHHISYSNIYPTSRDLGTLTLPGLWPWPQRRLVAGRQALGPTAMTTCAASLAPGGYNRPCGPSRDVFNWNTSSMLDSRALSHNSQLSNSFLINTSLKKKLKYFFSALLVFFSGTWICLVLFWVILLFWVLLLVLFWGKFLLNFTFFSGLIFCSTLLGKFTFLSTFFLVRLVFLVLFLSTLWDFWSLRTYMRKVVSWHKNLWES